MREYRCTNPRCRRVLFESDAIAGRLRLTCPARICKKAQWVFLGGHFKERRLSFPADFVPVGRHGPPREAAG